MAQTKGGKTGLVVGGLLGAAGLAAVVYEVTKKKPAAGGTTTATPQVTFSGIEGAISPGSGGALPALVTSFLNPDSAPHTYAVSAASGPITWTPDTTSFTLQPNGSRNVNWSATWTSSEGSGPFQTVLSVGVDSLATQSFTDPTTFTISVSQSPAAASVQFEDGPSGTVTIQEGQSLSLPELKTVVTNTGQQSGSFTVSAPLSGPAGNLAWYAASFSPSSGGSQGFSNPPTSVGPFTLAAGEAATIVWGTVFEDAQISDDGTYTTIVNVTVA